MVGEDVREKMSFDIEKFFQDATQLSEILSKESDDRRDFADQETPEQEEQRRTIYVLLALLEELEDAEVKQLIRSIIGGKNA